MGFTPVSLLVLHDYWAISATEQRHPMPEAGSNLEEGRSEAGSSDRTAFLDKDWSMRGVCRSKDPESSLGSTVP